MIGGVVGVRHTVTLKEAQCGIAVSSGTVCGYLGAIRRILSLELTQGDTAELTVLQKRYRIGHSTPSTYAQTERSSVRTRFIQAETDTWEKTYG